MCAYMQPVPGMPVTVTPSTNITPHSHPLAYNPYGYRPARRQREPVKGQLQQQEVQGEYNIWYHRYQGGDRFDKYKRADAVNPGSRVNIAQDAGYTKADGEPGTFICLYFARGFCERGAECTFLHRAPNEYDEVRTGVTVDVFGRDRHSTDREDMGGTGNFNRNNRTLYVAGFKTFPGDNPEEIIKKHFGEFGEIEHLNVIPGRSMGFITYKLRVCAEFAKEALANQNLDHDEVVNIRWAHVDPNPRHVKPNEKENEIKRAAAALAATNPALQAFAMMQAMQPPAKRAHGEADTTVAAYPNTDEQFSSGGARTLPEFSEFYTFDAVSQKYVYNFPWAYWAYVTGQAPSMASAVPPPAPPPEPFLPPELEDDEDRQRALEEVLRAQAAAFGHDDDAAAAAPADSTNSAPAAAAADVSSTGAATESAAAAEAPAAPAAAAAKAPAKSAGARKRKA